MIKRTAWLMILTAGALAGCTAKTGVRPNTGTTVDANARATTITNPVSLTPSICDFSNDPNRVRDLTVRWTQRRYLLPDGGGLCRPNTEGSSL